jgi:hypothetical protein
VDCSLTTDGCLEPQHVREYIFVVLQFKYLATLQRIWELYERYICNARSVGNITAPSDLFAKPLTALGANVKCH